jgi:hypothetical protein
MKATAKIAAGAILVGVVVGSMLKGPAWKQRARIWHYENILSHLTPDQAIALCGKPPSGRDADCGAPIARRASNDGVVRRRLIIRNYYKLAVELDFSATTAEPKKWRIASIQDPSGEIKYETRLIGKSAFRRVG